MCVAAGLAAVRAYKEEGLFERGREIETWIKDGLAPIVEKYDIVGEARGIGAFFALEFVKSKKGKEPLVAWHGEGGLGVMKTLYAELRKRGVYTFGKFNCTMVAPPLNVAKADLDRALVALDESIGELQKAL